MLLMDPALLGGAYDVVETRFPAALAGDQLLPADPNRIALLWGAQPAGATLVVSTLPLTTLGKGYGVPTTGYLEFVFGRHGPLVGRAWYCCVDRGNEELFAIEVFLRRPAAAQAG